MDGTNLFVFKYQERTMIKAISKFTTLILFLGLCSLGFSSCDNDTGEMMTPGFDRAGLLSSIGNELIIPNFTALQSSVDDMARAAEAFVQMSTEEKLLTLRQAWEQAVVDHQHCSAFGFGPANLLLGPYAEVLGVFPVNEVEVEQNLLNPNFDLANSFDRDIRGFYTIEYLIFGDGVSNADLIAGFDQNRKDYLILIIGELESTFDNIVTEWTNGYLQSFIENDGTAAGSSISLLYNSFVKDYENLKNFKVELPAGLSAGQSGPDGQLVEALYSGISSDLIEAHFASSKNIWQGMSRNDEVIIGFDDYLNAVVGGLELVTQTETAIQDIDQVIADLPRGRLSEQVDNSILGDLRDQLQANTANFKSSMSSLLGISITFNSGDGD